MMLMVLFSGSSSFTRQIRSFSLPPRIRDLQSKRIRGFQPKAVLPSNVRGLVASQNLRGGFSLPLPIQRTVKVIAGMNFLGFVISIIAGGHTHLDLLGTGAFVVSALSSHQLAPPAIRSAPRQLLITSLVSIWGTRLAGFLFYRVLQSRNDARLDELMNTTSGAATFWGLSYLWGQLVILPQAMVLNIRPIVPIGIGGCACAVLSMTGIALEAIADWQKFCFKKDTKQGENKFCDIGLWKVSQHPNYAGEILTWLGIFGLAVPVLRANPGATKRLAIAATGPTFLTFLLAGQARGDIGNANELAAKKFSGDAKYEEYIKNTPLIFPTSLSSLRE